MLDREHENDYHLILYRTDRPPVPDTILPKLSQLRACERRADATGIFPALYSLVKEPQYTCGQLPIEFF